MIYFLRSGELVKIGCAKSFERRMYELRRDLPCPRDCDLLGEMTGRRKGEQILHDWFRPHHAFGEWFWLTPEIETFIESFCDEPSQDRRHAITIYMWRSTSKGWRPEDREKARQRRQTEIKAHLRRVAARRREERAEMYASRGWTT